MEKKKKARKSGAARSVKDLPVKSRTAESVKGARPGFNDISVSHQYDKSSPVFTSDPKK
jgi:hypothetical protein